MGISLLLQMLIQSLVKHRESHCHGTEATLRKHVRVKYLRLMNSFDLHLHEIV